MFGGVTHRSKVQMILEVLGYADALDESLSASTLSQIVSKVEFADYLVVTCLANLGDEVEEKL
jgi:hypothetical protein